MDVTDAAQANAKALDLLNKGVTSLGLMLKVDHIDVDFVVTLLNNINPETVELNFYGCISQVPDIVELLTGYFASKGYDASKLKGSVNCDPMNRMLTRGRNFSKEEVSGFVTAAANAAVKLPKYRVVTVNALTLNNAGAYCAQELGYALAWGNEYLRMMMSNGVSAAVAATAMKFNMGIGSNYFMEIAKFRAARWLWAEIVNAYKPASDYAARLNIYAETSKFNTTIYDANVNMLRTQTEAMSASLAGVNSLTVNPYDSAYKPSDDFSERIARNQQLMLKEESHFDKVVDPAAGSYYIETLTNSLGEEAWKLFLEIESKGGFYKAIVEGEVQQAIKATAKKRFEAIATRRENLLGTNQFPNFTEKAASKIDKTTSSCTCTCGCEKGIETLEPVRGGEEFEALRLATEAASKTPKAFMLTIGNLAMRLARAQFSCNFFACAGYQVIDNLGFNTVEEGIAAAQKADADIIVLCSSDDEYTTLAPEAYKAIAGKQIFVVAGAPACMDELKAVGIEHFINVKSNVLETLKAFNKQLVK